jgi:hypothetical protein
MRWQYSVKSVRLKMGKRTLVLKEIILYNIGD